MLVYDFVGLTICGIGRSFATCSTNAGRRNGGAAANAATGITAPQAPNTAYQHHQHQTAALALPLATALTRTASIKSQFLGNINF